jgi:hypothetical protein
MFCCCGKKNNIPVNNSTHISIKMSNHTNDCDKSYYTDKILHENLNKLVKLNIEYNIKFNKITNEINKIKLHRENKEVFELDSVRKYTPIKIYSSVLDDEINIIKKRPRGVSAPPQLITYTYDKVSYV